MDDRYMVAHQRLDELDFLWLLWVLHQNSKETLDRVCLKISSLFLRVDTCTLFWLWCDEITQKYLSISEFATSIFLHRDFEFSIFSRTLARLHRESDEIVSRFEWCSEFRLYLSFSDVVYCYSFHEDIIYDYAENQILFWYPYFPHSFFSKCWYRLAFCFVGYWWSSCSDLSCIVCEQYDLESLEIGESLVQWLHDS